MAGARPEQPARAGDDLGQELVEGACARDRLGELGDRLELVDARSRLVVEPCVLDRPGDERRARDDEVDLGLRERVRCLGMGADDADHRPVACRNRDAEERLEPLLVELRDVGDTGIGEEVVGDEGGLVPLGGPPREAASPLAGRPCRSAPRTASPAARRTSDLVLDQVDEAGVHGACVGEEPHDGTKNLVEVECRGDGRDDPREDGVALCDDRCHDGIVERRPRQIKVRSGRELVIPAAASPSATKPVAATPPHPHASQASPGT